MKMFLKNDGAAMGAAGQLRESECSGACLKGFCRFPVALAPVLSKPTGNAVLVLLRGLRCATPHRCLRSGALARLFIVYVVSVLFVVFVLFVLSILSVVRLRRRLRLLGVGCVHASDDSDTSDSSDYCVSI